MYENTNLANDSSSIHCYFLIYLCRCLIVLSCDYAETPSHQSGVVWVMWMCGARVKFVMVVLSFANWLAIPLPIILV